MPSNRTSVESDTTVPTDRPDRLEIRRNGLSEHHATVRSNPEETPRDLGRRVGRTAASGGLRVVKMDAFGASSCAGEFLEGLREIAGSDDWPVTWAGDLAEDSRRVAGVHLWAVTGTPVETLRFEGRPVGRVFSDAFARYAALGGLVPRDPEAPRAEQTRDVLEQMEGALDAAGMRGEDVVRTWYYNDRILEWYDAFNAVRTEVYGRRRFFDGILPASTGIGAPNPSGGALTLALLAVRPHEKGAISIREAVSPLQGPAPAYGSSFSRGAVVETSDLRRLTVSGTASICPGGDTIHREDTRAQIRRTMDVVAGILSEAGANWTHLTRGIAYFADAEQFDLFEEWLAETATPRFPFLCAHNDVCRSDLLFEFEADALIPLPLFQR